MGLWLEKRFQAFAYFESEQEYQDAEAAVAEFVEPGALSGDFLDFGDADFVGDAVADGFDFHSFDGVADYPVTIFRFHLRYHYGVWVRG